MFKTTLSLLLLLTASAGSRADDKEKADNLRKEIAELRSQLAAKEAELAKLDPVRMVRYLWTHEMKPGDVGQFGLSITRPRTVVSDGKSIRVSETSYSEATLRAEKVIDKTSAIVSILTEKGQADKVKVILTNFDTSGVPDGKTFRSPVCRVIGTRKIEDTTYSHVEVWTLPYTQPKK